MHKDLKATSCLSLLTSKQLLGSEINPVENTDCLMWAGWCRNSLLFLVSFSSSLLLSLFLRIDLAVHYSLSGFLIINTPSIFTLIYRSNLSICLSDIDKYSNIVKYYYTSILDNTSIQCHWLSNFINWEWKEYARGVSPRSVPLDLSAEAGKCSPGEVTGLSHAVFVWQKACWHFLDVKEQFVYSSKHNCCWQLSIHCPATGASFVKELAGTFRDLGDWVSGASSIQYSSVGFPCRGERVNAKFTGMNVREQPPTMCWDIVPCQVSSLHLWVMGLFLEDSSRNWQKQQKQ